MKSHDMCELNCTLVISSDPLTDSALGEGFIKPHFKCILMGRDKCVAGFTEVQTICEDQFCTDSSLPVKFNCSLSYYYLDCCYFVNEHFYFRIIMISFF